MKSFQLILKNYYKLQTYYYIKQSKIFSDIIIQMYIISEIIP